MRLYGYISQLITFQDADLEKEYVFARNLNRKLPKRTGAGLPREVVDAVDLDSFRIQETFEGEIDLLPEDAVLPGVPTEARPAGRESEMDFLSNIVSNLNETFGIDLTEKDRIRVEEIVREVQADEGVRAVMAGNNSMGNKRHKVHQVIDSRILDQVHHSIDLYKKLNDPQVKAAFKSRLFEQLTQQFAQVEL